MEVYQEAMQGIERERINFLDKIDLVQPSFDEQHQLEWGSRYQEEELLSLRSELTKVSRELELETKQLRDREEVIQAIREEQQQDRVKIQTLLALSQPITPDITVVFQALAPDACPPPPPPPPPPPSASAAAASRDGAPRSGRPSLSRHNSDVEEGAFVPPPRPPGIAVAATAGEAAEEDAGRGGFMGGDRRTSRARTAMSRTATSVAAIGEYDAEDGGRSRRKSEGGRGSAEDRAAAVQGRRRTVGRDGGGVWQHRRPNRVRVTVGGDGDGGDDDEDGAGTVGGSTGHNSSADEDTKGEDGDEEEDGGDSDGHPPREGSSPGSSYGLRPGRPWDSEVARGHAERAGVHQRDGVTRRRRRRRSRGAEGRQGGAGGRPGTKREKEANRLRCTRGYQEHLERRLELTQKHLSELARLDGSFRETLDRDRQEREIQVQVQRENDSLVVDILKRRTAEVDKRVAAATEDYLRLRHKAKEARAASATEQRRCAEAREKSQAEVRALLSAAERDIEAIKQEGRRRLDDCTVGLREDLGTSEERLQSERVHQADIKRRIEERVGRAREGVLLTRRRYHKLVRRRAQEVVHLSEEMSALRRGVTELERRMFQAW